MNCGSMTPAHGEREHLLPKVLKLSCGTVFTPCVNMITFRFVRKKTEWIFIMSVAKVAMRRRVRTLEIFIFSTLDTQTLLLRGVHSLFLLRLSGMFRSLSKRKFFTQLFKLDELPSRASGFQKIKGKTADGTPRN